MKKKILLIIEHLGSGGAERQICGLSSLLTQNGYPCKLITYCSNQFYEPFLRENNVDYEFRPELLNKKTRVFRLVRYIYSYKPDVVISFLPSVNLTTCLARLFIKFELIVSERNNNINISKFDTILFNLYRFADYIVPNSHSQANFISNNFPFLEKKIHTIINYVDINKFTPTTDDNNNESIKIITVARYTAQKNCLKYLETIKRIKGKGLNVNFVWFGSKSYDKEYYEQIERKVNELGIADYITLQDTSADIVSEYQNSTIFCLPSIFEGYPNVIVEAMCCGLPILCSKVYENPHIVIDGENGFLFDPNDIGDIEEKILMMVNLSKEELKVIGLKNRQDCIERNSPQKFIEAYIKLIENE